MRIVPTATTYTGAYQLLCSDLRAITTLVSWQEDCFCNDFKLISQTDAMSKGSTSYNFFGLIGPSRSQSRQRVVCGSCA